MLESINIKQVASYDEAGIQITGLKKVNFIYGANGCGKTTISNFLHNTDDVAFPTCEVTWKNATQIKTLVYNKQFRERNYGKGKLGGIFTLGEATADEISVIETKVEQLKVIKTEVVAKREALLAQKARLEVLENDLKEDAWTKVYKKYETVFNEAFEGAKSKDRFKNRLLAEFGSNTMVLQTIEALKEKATTIFGDAPTSLNPINTFNYDRIIEITNNPIWKKIIVGKADVDIATLIQKLNINDWVNQGRSYIQEDDTCPFCQQNTISEDFKSQLENYFDEAYLKDLETITTLKQEYNQLIDNLINELSVIEEFQKSNDKSKLNNDTFSAYLKTLNSQCIANNEFLSNKVKEPSRIFELVSLKEQLDLIAGLITTANTEIAKNNTIVLNFTSEKSNLILSVWKFLIEEYRTQIVAFNTSKSGMERGITNIDAQLTAKLLEQQTLDAEIKNLSKNVTSIQPTINEINRLLNSYGFHNFEIVPATEDGFYQIKREDGSIAEATLSEGEITFITFLYYLQLTKGGVTEDTVNEERILVIDDPISSLDSNVLFLVSTLIKEIIKKVRVDNGNIKQVILLTHNVYFHKEVSYVDNTYRGGERANFWILRKNFKYSNIQPYMDKNPIQSSYELLWREIREWSNNSGITIQNTMRRILENYFAILGNRRDDFLISKFDNREDKDICRSLLSWTNEGSHTMPDDLFIELPDGVIEKYIIVFKNIFLYTDNYGHYNMMMQISEDAEQVEELAQAN